MHHLPLFFVSKNSLGTIYFTLSHAINIYHSLSLSIWTLSLSSSIFLSHPLFLFPIFISLFLPVFCKIMTHYTEKLCLDNLVNFPLDENNVTEIWIGKTKWAAVNLWIFLFFYFLFFLPLSYPLYYFPFLLTYYFFVTNSGSSSLFFFFAVYFR